MYSLNYIYPTQTKVTRAHRELLLQQRPMSIWFTGLSGSGKSTLAIQLESELHQRGFKTYLLDGDNMRSGLNKDLSFTQQGRIENIRRISEVSKLFLDAGLIVLSAFISPFNDDRVQVREIIGDENHIEVFVDCPLSVCEQRDVKGLYRRARAGEIKNFTGIDSPYERPANSDVIIKSAEMSVEESMEILLSYLSKKIAR